MAGEGSSNIGDVVATLRADLRDFVTNVQAAKLSLDGLGQSATGNERVINLVSKAIDNWTILLARGKVTNEQFAVGIERLKTSFGGLLAPVQQASTQVASFSVGGATGSRGLYMVDRAIAGMAASALGASGRLGTLAAGMLIFGTGSAVTLGVVGAAGLMVAGYLRWTEQTRKVKEEHEALLKTLDKEALESVPAAVAAQSKLTVAQEAYTEAIQAQSDANRVLQQFAGATSFGGIQVRGPVQLKGQPTDAEQKAFGEMLQAQADIYKTSSAALNEYVGNLSKAIRLQVASSSEVREAVELEGALAKATHDTSKSMADRIKAQEELNELISAFRERVADLEEMNRLNIINRDTTNDTANAIDALTTRIASGHGTRQQLIQDVKDLDALMKQSELGQLQLAPVTLNLGPMQPAKLPSNWSVEIDTKMTDTMKELRRIVARGVDDIIKTFVEGILGGTQSLAQALIKTFERAIAQLVAALAAEKILDPLYKLLHLDDPGGKILGGGGDSGGGGGDLASAIIGGATSLLSARSASVMVPLSGIPAPALPSPAIAARDTYWRSVVTETVRVINANGGRVLIG